MRPTSAFLAILILLAAGCSSTHSAPARPIYEEEAAKASRESVHLLSANLRDMVAVEVQTAGREDDGRIIAAMNLRNRTEEDLHLQARCVFKDSDAMSTGDESSWQDVFLKPLQIQTVRASSLKRGAELYTFEVREVPIHD